MKDGSLSSAVHFALRRLRRRPAAALLIVLTMAIGVAPASAIFTVVRGVLLRPLPYRDASSLVTIEEYQATRPNAGGAVSFASLSRYRQAHSIEALTAFSYSELVVSGDADAERFIGANVDPALLPTLGVRPRLGRGIDDGDGGETPARVAVLSYAMWRRRYGGDSSAVGRSITIDGAPYTVIGVMPEAFEFPRNPAMDRDVDLWVPRRPPPPMMVRRGVRDLTVIARVRGADLTNELASIASRAEADDPSNKGWRVRAVGLREIVVGRVRPTLLMLAVCVGVLLLIACVNASAAALARATVERRSLGVQLALGADQRHLAVLVAVEMAALAAVALIVAVPLSVALRGALIRIAPVAIPRQAGIAIDATVLAFAALVAVATGLIGAVGPIVWLRRLDPVTLVSEATRSATGSRGRTRALSTFVSAQAALGTALIGITLAAYEGFARLNHVDPGFDSRDVVTATVPLRGARYRTGEARALLTEQLLVKIRALPGVRFASVGSLMPLSGGLMSGSYQVIGSESDPNARAVLRAVSSDFFPTLGIRLESGRPIQSSDNPTTPLVAVVNHAFANRAFGAERAIGRQLVISPPGSDSAQTFDIVGVVGDAMENNLTAAPSPIIYFSDQQASFPRTVLAVRSLGVPPLTAIRQSLRELDPALALDDPSPLVNKVRATYGLQIFLINVLTFFAGSAALLIAVGVYGSVSYVVMSDHGATGVRIAIGASGGRIVGWLLKRTALAALVGCAIGLPASIAVVRLYSAMNNADTPLASLIGALAVALLATAATLMPALRASRTDPLSVLRE